LTISK